MFPAGDGSLPCCDHGGRYRQLFVAWHSPLLKNFELALHNSGLDSSIGHRLYMVCMVHIIQYPVKVSLTGTGLKVLTVWRSQSLLEQSHTGSVERLQTVLVLQRGEK